MTQSPTQRRWPGELALWGALLALSLALFGHFLFGRLPISGDMTLFYAPFYSLRFEGGLPLWNRYLAGGMPMDANPQFSLVYPLRWPFFFLSDWRSYFSLYHYLHYLIAMAGTVGLVRSMGSGKVAAFASAAAFACGAYMVGRIINTTIFLSSCWLPWLVWGAAERRPRGGPIAALGIAAIMWIGSPHLMAYGSIGFALAMFVMFGAHHGSAPTDGSGPARVPPAVRAWIGRWVYFALGVGMGLVNVLPSALQVDRTLRSQTDLENNLADSLGWAELIPSFFGGGGGVVYPENNDKCFYVGGVALLVILVALLRPGSRRRRRFWAGIVLTFAGLAIALGHNLGWQFVIPHIWGLNLLEGPARALVLTALGLAILVAHGLEAIAELKPRALLAVSVFAFLGAAGVGFWNAYGVQQPQSFFDLIRLWAVAPGGLLGPSFSLLNLMLTLGAAALAALLLFDRARLAALAVTALLALDLWHFAPRVEPQTVDPSQFDPPPSVQFLMQARADSPEPFRVAAFDPFRFHHTEMDSLYKPHYLMANLATIYGLEDVSVFDPLVPLEYKRLFDRTSGIAEFNDPIRHIDLGRPDEDLLRTLGVRYLIGHPRDRRFTLRPQLLSFGAPRTELTEWSDRTTTGALEAWHFVSLVDGRSVPSVGKILARLVVVAEEGEFTYPVRYGFETAHIRAHEQNVAKTSARPNMRWHRFITAPGSSVWVETNTNYRATIDFGRPLHVRRIRWELADPDFIVFIAAQGYRLAPKGTEEPWRLVLDDPIAPVHEFLAAQPRASFHRDYDLNEGEAERLGPRSEKIVPAEVSRSANRVTYRVAADDRGLFVLTESWAPGWRVRVDGLRAELVRVNRLFRGVELTAREHRVEFYYFPLAFYSTLPVSLLCAAIVLFALLARIRRRGQKRLAPP